MGGEQLPSLRNSSAVRSGNRRAHGGKAFVFAEDCRTYRLGRQPVTLLRNHRVLCKPQIFSSEHNCSQVSCIYGLGMPSKYLEASIRVFVGQQWEGGWRTLARHLEQVFTCVEPFNVQLLRQTSLQQTVGSLLVYSLHLTVSACIRHDLVGKG